MAAVRDVGERVGITVTLYDFSKPQYGKDVCDRILCPMKSAIRRYCNEGHDVISAKDMLQHFPNLLLEAQLPAFAP